MHELTRDALLKMQDAASVRLSQFQDALTCYASLIRRLKCCSDNARNALLALVVLAN